MDVDRRLAEIVRAELTEGNRVLIERGLTGASVQVHQVAFDTTLVELRGRFSTLPDREVAGVVEIDPARVGWRLEAGLYEYRDAAESEELVRDLGMHRTAELEIAAEAARQLARSAWVAVMSHASRGDG